MRKIIIFLCLYLGLNLNSLYAGGGGGPDAYPYFAPPMGYIDIDYTYLYNSRNDDVNAAAFTPDSKRAIIQKYGLIILHYAKILGKRSFVLNDSYSRRLSAAYEPENYQLYLKAAKYFKNGRYDDALKIFKHLTNHPIALQTWIFNKKKFTKPYSWTKEASTYMIARCQLRIAQKNYDGFSKETIGITMLLQADISYRRYVHEYPNGLYTDSARNIPRFILRLADNTQKLNQELKDIMTMSFASHESNTNLLDIADEFWFHFDGKIDIQHDAPILVAYAFLEKDNPTHQDLKTLEKRKNDFKNFPDLFEYLRRLGLYRLGMYQQVLDIPPKTKNIKDIFSRSTEFLRYKSLLKLHKPTEAFDVLKNMYFASEEEALFLEMLSFKLDRNDSLLWFFKNKVPRYDYNKTDASVFQDYGNEEQEEDNFTHVRWSNTMMSLLYSEPNDSNATADWYGKDVSSGDTHSLTMIARFFLTDKELQDGILMKDITGVHQEILMDTIAWRFLLSQRYKELSLLLKKEKVIETFIPVQSKISILAKNPNNNKALVDVAEFIYKKAHSSKDNIITDVFYFWQKGIDCAIDQISSVCKRCDTFLKGHPITLSNTFKPPVELFMRVVENSKRLQKKSASEAKALHYLTKCFRPYEWSAMCLWDSYLLENKKYDSKISKMSFLRLHKLYKNSAWAKKTPYYYD